MTINNVKDATYYITEKKEDPENRSRHVLEVKGKHEAIPNPGNRLV
jgi:hypothetical protein